MAPSNASRTWPATTSVVNPSNCPYGLTEKTNSCLPQGKSSVMSLTPSKRLTKSRTSREACFSTRASPPDKRISKSLPGGPPCRAWIVRVSMPGTSCISSRHLSITSLVRTSLCSEGASSTIMPPMWSPQAVFHLAKLPTGAPMVPNATRTKSISLSKLVSASDSARDSSDTIRLALLRDVPGVKVKFVYMMSLSGDGKNTN